MWPLNWKFSLEPLWSWVYIGSKAGGDDLLIIETVSSIYFIKEGRAFPHLGHLLQQYLTIDGHFLLQHPQLFWVHIAMCVLPRRWHCMASFLFPVPMFFPPLLLQHSLGLRVNAINVLYVNTHLLLVLRTLWSHELILHCSLEKDPSLVKAENSICLCV